MAITNQATLEAAVASWLHRTDLTTQIPDFISLAETKLNRILRIRAMETITTGTVSATIALPTDFLEVKAMTVTTGGTTYALKYVTPNEVTATSGIATSYSLIGDSIYFNPVGSGETYNLLYYKRFPALSLGANWLITNAPDVYLFAALLEACPYIRIDPQTKADWASSLNDSINQLMSADNGDRYGSTLTVRSA